MAEFVEDVICETLVADRIVLPLNSVGNTQFDPSEPLGAEKQEHQIPATYCTSSTTAVTAGTFPLYQAFAAGRIHSIYAGLVDPCVDDAVIEIDIKKNNVSILSTAFELTEVDAAFEKLDAGIGSADYIAGDFFEVVVTVDVGTGTLGKGLIVTLMLREKPE